MPANVGSPAVGPAAVRRDHPDLVGHLADRLAERQHDLRRRGRAATRSAGGLLLARTACALAGAAGARRSSEPSRRRDRRRRLPASPPACRGRRGQRPRRSCAEGPEQRPARRRRGGRSRARARCARTAMSTALVAARQRGQHERHRHERPGPFGAERGEREADRQRDVERGHLPAGVHVGADAEAAPAAAAASWATASDGERDAQHLPASLCRGRPGRAALALVGRDRGEDRRREVGHLGRRPAPVPPGSPARPARNQSWQAAQPGVPVDLRRPAAAGPRRPAARTARPVPRRMSWSGSRPGAPKSSRDVPAGSTRTGVGRRPRQLVRVPWVP